MTDLETVWREEWGRLLALLLAQTRRLDLAEDALADAFEAAARRWPAEGAPESPPAWLLTVARRRIVDRQRAEAVAARKMPLIAVEEQQRDSTVPDDGHDLLRLVLLAAHPALAPEAGAALTLRLVLGVATADIARLFLVSEPTMAARLTRARKKVVAAGVPFAIPEPEVLATRLDTVAQVVYLAFTAGYAPGSGPDVVRIDLAGEAIRLVELVRTDDVAAERNPALVALHALMLLQHSRRFARTSADGSLVLLDDQDRRLWRFDEIDRALHFLTPLIGRLSTLSAVAQSFLLQATIAAVHATAPTAADTDWVRIAALYAELEALTGSPVVRLNRAVAVAQAQGPTAGLGILDGLDDDLGSGHRLPAVRAELLARAGRSEEALAAYSLAIERCDNEPESAALLERVRAFGLAHVDPG